MQVQKGFTFPIMTLFDQVSQAGPIPRHLRTSPTHPRSTQKTTPLPPQKSFPKTILTLTIMSLTPPQMVTLLMTTFPLPPIVIRAPLSSNWSSM